MTLALYRRYRPTTLAELVGQEHVTGPLGAALDAGPPGSAYLFSGPAGCGKSSLARILARCLNCDRGPSATPCGRCPSCLALLPEGPGTADVIELDACVHGGIDDMRMVRERVGRPPTGTRFRVVIVDQAQMLTGMAATALLGILERAPESAVVVLVTDRPASLPATLRSRTLHYRLRSIRSVALAGWLRQVCDREGVPAEPAALALAARAADGSARQAVSVLEQLLAGAGGDGITGRAAAELLADVDTFAVDDIVDAVAAGDGSSMFDALDRALRSTDDAWGLATALLRRLRDVIVLAGAPDAATHSLIDAPADQLPTMTGQAAALGLAGATGLADAVAAARERMQGNTPHRLVLELACARALTSRGRVTGPLVGDPPGVPPPPRPPDRPAVPPPAASGGTQSGGTQLALTTHLGVEDLRRVWPQVLAAVQRQRTATEAVLRYAQVVDIDDGVLHLALPSPALVRRLMEPANVDVVRRALLSVTGLEMPVVARESRDGA